MALINFYGEECPHCDRMVPIMDRLEKEKNMKIERYEVWHNAENRKKFDTYDSDGACGGVPFFINTTTSKTICGEVSYEELLEWSK